MEIIIDTDNPFRIGKRYYYVGRDSKGDIDSIYVPHEITETNHRALNMAENGKIPQDVLYPPKKKKIPDWLKFFDK